MEHEKLQKLLAEILELEPEQSRREKRLPEEPPEYRMRHLACRKM